MFREYRITLSREQWVSLGVNLWIYRLRRGLSRRDLAEGTLKPHEIRIYERGGIAIPAVHLVLLMRRLDVRFEELIAPPNYQALLNRSKMRDVIKLYAMLSPERRAQARAYLRKLGQGKISK